MPNTPNLNLPYPADTDYVANGYLDIEQLATAIDNLFGPSSTYTPGTANISSPTVVGHYLIVGKWLQVWVQISAGTATATGTVDVELPPPYYATGRTQLVLGNHTGDLCRAYVASNSNLITIAKDYTGANFNNGHNLATTRVQGWVEVQ